MLDLAARVFYKAHFDIVRETEDLDLLRDVIVADLSEWLKRKYRGSIRYWNWTQFAEYGNFDTENHRTIASTTSFRDKNSRCWACKIEEFEMIRLMYVYDNGITDELIGVMSSEDKICKYY